MLQVKHLAAASIVLFIFAGASSAQEPDEDTKTRALKRAYQLNGNSMVRWGSVDLTGGPLPADDAVCIQINGEATGQQFFECRQPVKTVPIMPVADPREKNIVDEAADLNMDDIHKFLRRHNAKIARDETNICTIHHMRKVVTGDGWRCRK